MDAQVKNAIVTVRKLGNIPESAVVFFDKEKPTETLQQGIRFSFLRFKTDKDAGTKRENMAVRTSIIDPDLLTSKPEHEFLQALVCEHHDSVMVRCANGEISWDEANSPDFMVKDYFDTSRDSSGRKISKESIAAWFMATVANTVEIRAKTKNAQMSAETIAKVVQGYCEMFQKFTKYDLVNLFTEPQLELLRTLMISTTISEDDLIAEYVLSKLDKIAQLKVEQNSLLDAI